MNKLFSLIRQLSNEAISCANNDEIEKCLKLLVERHAMLENLQVKLTEQGLLSWESDSKKLFVELLKETQEFDKGALENIIQKRAQAQQTIQQQFQKTKAISAYQKSLLG